jgi:hypothetical protein
MEEAAESVTVRNADYKVANELCLTGADSA